MRITVYGLWHLGCVTAACLSEAGHRVTGLDPDEAVVANLRRGRAPLHEPGLDDLIGREHQAGRLTFTCGAAEALAEAEVLWVAFDTPVNEHDEADVDFVCRRVAAIAGAVQPGTLVLISSQVPVGFTRETAKSWPVPGCRFACAPENLRLGRALDSFRRPERVVVGVCDSAARAPLTQLFAPFCERIEWMGIESAEMTKHALNAFLATSVTFINELARLCEATGADAKEVERGLKSEGRIGPQAYLSPGAAFAGGTLARDVRFLVERGKADALAVPLLEGVWASNEVHKDWVRHQIRRLIVGPDSLVAVLGLTYKPGTSTLRRSSAMELCRWLTEQGIRVRGHDPAVTILPDELRPTLELATDPLDALADADLAVIATPWPDYRTLAANAVCARMRRPRILDPNHFLAGTLGSDPRITYVATGRAAA
jgi:UDPglucose 6-dehydrogenase